MISPDGKKVAFAAVGDIYVMPVGGKPENITNDKYLDTDPAWSPDGNQLVYSSDKGGSLLQLWIRDMKTGPGPPAHASDHAAAGRDLVAGWQTHRVLRRGRDVARRQCLGGRRGDRQGHEDSRLAVRSRECRRGRRMESGSPSPWSSPYSKSFREGTNQILTMSSEGASDDEVVRAGAQSFDRFARRLRPGLVAGRHEDGRDLRRRARGLAGVASGEPLGPPRHITTEIAHSPSWAGDSKHILYQSMDKLKTIDIESGETREIPLDLKYTPSIPKGRMVVHAGQLVDGRARRRAPTWTS